MISLHFLRYQKISVHYLYVDKRDEVQLRTEKASEQKLTKVRKLDSPDD